MTKKIIIIGAGISGLAAGTYGRMNGFETTIYELHSQPGGLCTSWERGGYTFDGCIHWLVGTNPNSDAAIYWRELGALRNMDIYDPEEFMRYESSDGKTLVFYTDLEKLRKEMISVAPEDEKTINEFINEALSITNFFLLLPQKGSKKNLRQWWDLIWVGLPFLLKMKKYGSISIHEYAQRFVNPFLRKAFVAHMDMPDFPMAAVFIAAGWRHIKDAGYPIGGSLVFAKNIEKRYKELGGEIFYNSRVEKIIVEGGKAVGVRLIDGREAFADYILSAADGYKTHYELLGEEYLTEEVASYYKTMPIFPPLIQVSYGVNMDTTQLPEVLQFELERPIRIAEKERKALYFRNMKFDPTLAEKGKGVIIFLLKSDYDYWKKIYADREEYESEKKDVAIKILQQMDKRIPGFAEKVEVIDVATPMTYERYTNNWKGAMEGWLLTKKSFAFLINGKGMKKTLPSVENFMMVGQWVEPGGGIPTAARSARNAIEALCRKENIKFTVQVD